ncbi:MAG: hypothetical protein Q8M37_10635 [Nevskia sp.]|nr:hypothetical protein [Nevskia sp.]
MPLPSLPLLDRRRPSSYLRPLLTLLLSAALAACGGGGSSSDDLDLIGATNVIGQADYISGSANRATSVSALGLAQPLGGIATDGTNFFIADYGNHRVLGYASVPGPTTPALFVLGQDSTTGNLPGTGPTGLYIAYGVRSSAFEIPECLATQATAVLQFGGDESSNGEFTTRVVWHSNAPDVLYVADGINPGPDGILLAAGTLVGLKPGQAQLSATFSSFTATASVEIRASDSARIDPQLTDITERLSQPFHLLLRPTAESPEQDETNSVVWSFARPTASAAVESSTGIVSANSASSGAIELRARLLGCGREFGLPLRVSTPRDLRIDYEQGSELRLPVGYSEALSVYAEFATEGSAPQNLSTLVEIDGLDDDRLSITSGTEALYVQALDTSTSSGADTGFTLRLPDRSLSVASKRWQTTDAELLSFVLSPDTLNVIYPATGQFTAVGLFDDGVTRPVSRLVAWSSDDTSVVFAIGLVDDAGQVTVPNAEVTTTATATIAAAVDDASEFAVLRGYPAGSK